MAFSLGDYCYKGDITLLTHKTKDVKGANPELAGVDKKRYVYFQEPEKGRKLENSNIKDMTGGGELKARFCYSNKTSVGLHNTTVIECNDRPLLKEEPTKAEIRRIMDVLFESSFTETEEDVNEEKHIYKADPTLKELKYKEAHRIYFMNILMDHLQILKENNYTFDAFVPENVKMRSALYLQNCYEIHNLFIQLYEPAIYDTTLPDSKKPFISLNDVGRKMKQLEGYMLMSKPKKAEFTNDYIKTFFKTNKQYSKCYVDVLNYYDEEGKRKQGKNVLIGWKEREGDDE
jgi:hypothetical protein